MTQSIADRVWKKISPFYETIGFEPLPAQMPILCSRERYNIFAGGVGAGKSLTAAMYAAPRFLRASELPHQQLANYWIVGENYELPRIEFTYILEAYGKLQLPISNLRQPSDGRWHVEVANRAIIETRSWTNPESLHGAAVQGMIVVEAGLLPRDIWDLRLVPRLVRVPGSWCLWAGTIEEAGTFYKDMVRRVVIEKEEPGWFGTSMATWENTKVYPGGLENEEIQRLRETTPEDIFEERYAARPRTVAALVYREFSHKYHVYAESKWWDKHQPVYLFVDPAGVYALNAAQVRSGDIDIIDEIHGLHWTTEDAIREAVARPWWPNVEYVVTDAHAYHEQSLMWQGSSSVWGVLGETAKPVRSQHVPINSGIELVRSKLHSGAFDAEEENRLWRFEGKPGIARLRVAAHCDKTVYEFSEGYKRKRLRSGEYSPDEIVKRDNHHCSAIAYGLAELFGFVAKRPRARGERVPYVDSRPTVWW